MRVLVEYALMNAAMATALALLVYGVTRMVRRPAVRNALWLLVLVRLLLPPVWGVPLLSESAPVETPEPPNPVLESPRESQPGPGSELTAEELTQVMALLYGAEAMPIPARPVAPPAVVPQTVAPVSKPPASTVAFSWQFLWPLSGVVWLGGTAWIVLRSLRSIRRFQRLLSEATVAPPLEQARVGELATEMGLSRCPRLLFVPGRLWPSVWAPAPWRREAILLIPAGLWPLLDGEQRRAVLAHELSHCRRGDPWVRWLELIAVALYWWYLPLGWVRRELRQSEEECCDMRVVAALSGRRAYATALVETAVFMSGPEPAFSFALASGAGPVDDIQRRVTMIMRATWPAGLNRWGMAAVLGLGTIGVAVGPTLGTAEAQDKEKKEFPKKGFSRDKKGPEETPAGFSRDKKSPEDTPPGPGEDGERGPRPREKGPEGGGRGPGPDERPRGERPPGDRGDRGDRGEGGPGPRDRKANDEEIKVAQREAEAARAELRKAVERMVAAEGKLARIQSRGGNFPGGMMMGSGGGPGPGGGMMMGGGPGGPGGGMMMGSGGGSFGPMGGPGRPSAPGGVKGGGGSGGPEGGLGGGGFPGGAGQPGAPGGGFPGGGRGGAEGGAGQPGAPGGGGFNRGGAAGQPGGPGLGGGLGGPPGGPGADMNRRNEELERQVNELRKAVVEMRQMLREQIRQRDREGDKK